ncbi:MAG: hypothetical protein E7668_02575 [Ruminococcaceae bacterium]|nr:hypothetical protein [Oscillospiraceae bacterium]
MNTQVPTSLPRPSLRLGGTLTRLTVGGAAYYALELACRGYSHWSMALCGGLCLDAIYRMNRRLKNKNICLRAAAGSGIITAVELACGCIVNLSLRLKVWDYSHLPYNFLGQICLPFSLLWMGLCIPVCAVCSFVQREPRPKIGDTATRTDRLPTENEKC